VTIKAAAISEVGKIFLAPGHHSQICQIFLATKLSKTKRKLEETEEGMKMKKVTIKEFQGMIKKGLIKDSPTIAAFGLLMAKNILKF
jgi:ADP-ribose pyrophosphatase